MINLSPMTLPSVRNVQPSFTEALGAASSASAVQLKKELEGLYLKFKREWNQPLSEAESKNKFFYEMAYQAWLNHPRGVPPPVYTPVSKMSDLDAAKWFWSGHFAHDFELAPKLNDLLLKLISPPKSTIRELYKIDKKSLDRLYLMVTTFGYGHPALHDKYARVVKKLQ